MMKREGWIVLDVFCDLLLDLDSDAGTIMSVNQCFIFMPDYTTILHSRHLLARQKLGRAIFQATSEWLTDAGIILRESTLVDAIIIEAPTSIENIKAWRL